MDEEILNKILKAGKIAAQVRREGAVKLAKEGTSFLEVMDYCEKRIIELKGEIAWAQMAVNDVAAHYCPLENDENFSKEGDLIKIDIGVHLDGYIADNAMSIEVNSSYSSDLIKASQNALKSAIKLVRPGTQLWELGEAQYSEAEKMGFTTIKNLSGHTLGRYKVHGGISIPTFNNKDKRELEENWQIAIEPFITEGDGYVKEKGTSTIFMASKNKSTRSLYGKKILQEVENLNGLPFTTRWITRKFGRGVVLGLRDLQRTGAITAYPPLAEVTGRKVAQFEHSMIVKDKPIVYTRVNKDLW